MKLHADEIVLSNKSKKVLFFKSARALNLFVVSINKMTVSNIFN